MRQQITATVLALALVGVIFVVPVALAFHNTTAQAEVSPRWITTPGADVPFTVTVTNTDFNDFVVAVEITVPEGYAHVEDGLLGAFDPENPDINDLPAIANAPAGWLRVPDVAELDPNSTTVLFVASPDNPTLGIPPAPSPDNSQAFQLLVTVPASDEGLAAWTVRAYHLPAESHVGTTLDQIDAFLASGSTEPDDITDFLDSLLQVDTIPTTASPSQPMSLSTGIDSTAPTTALTTVPSLADGANGWFVSNVLIQLACSDGPSSSGCDETRYSIDGGAVQVYGAPFGLPGDGIFEITYYSDDVAGNVEATQGPVVVKQDTVPPVTTHAANAPAPTSWYNEVTGAASITLSCSDVTSGCDATSYSWNGGAAVAYAGAFGVPADGVHALRYSSVDEASNAESPVGPVTFRQDLVDPSCSLAITDAVAEGYITGSATLTATCSDATSGAASVAFYLGSSATGTPFSTDTDGSDGFSAAFDTTSLSDGENSFTIRALDVAGNSADVSGTVTVDNTEADVSINSLPDYYGSTSVTLTFGAGDGTSGIGEIQVEAKSLAGFVPIPGSPFPAGTTSATFAGTHGTAYEFRVRAVNGAGIVSGYTTPVGTTVDVTAPLALITGPLQDSFLRLGVDVVGTADDATSPVTWDLRLTDAASDESCLQCGRTDDVAAGNLHTGLATGSYPDGPSVFRLDVSDSAVIPGTGLPNTASTSVGVVFDNTVPSSAVVVTPLDADNLRGTVTIKATATDATSGIMKVEFFVDGVSVGVDAAPDASGNYSADFTSGLGNDVEDGARTITVVATDKAGNTLTSTAVGVIVDNVAPVTSAATLLGGQASGPDGLASWFVTPPTVELACSDAAAVATSGCSATKYTIDGGAVQDYSAPFALPGDGSFTINFWSSDNSGNVEDKLLPANTIVVKLDTVDPSVAITSPAQDAFLATQDVAVSFTSSDATSGILSRECSTNAGANFSACSSGNVHALGLDGAASVIVRVTDNAGRSSTASVSFVIDTLLPTVSISAPIAGAVLGSRDITVQFTDDGTGTLISARECSTGGAFAACASGSVLSVGADGDVTITVRVTDQAGNQGTDSVTVDIDTINPTVTITKPLAGAFLDSRNVQVNFTTDGTGSSIAARDCSIDGGATYASCSSGDILQFSSDGASSIVVRVADQAGNEGSATVNFVIDTVAPTVAISGPASGAFLPSRNVTGTFTADGTGSDVAQTECSYDGGASFIACSSGDFNNFAADGAASIAVRATDQAGNQGSSTVSFTIDTALPTVLITSPTSGSHKDSRDVFVVFQDDGTGSGVDARECSIDAGANFVACQSGDVLSFSNDGAASILVRATDQAGNQGSASVSFTVDTGLPAVNISAPVSGAFLPSANVQVSFTTSDSTSSVTGTECSIDGGANFAACASSDTLAYPGDGAASIQVRATDQAGNQGSSTVSFTIDATPPSVAIISPVGGSFLSNGSVDVVFNINEVNIASVACSVDGGAAAACTSPLNLNLADGAHSVLVSAVDLAGNSGNASVSFTVDATGPVVNITAPLAGSFLPSGAVGVEFSVAETNLASLECSVDGGAAAACTSPLNLNLADGAHSVGVTAVDSAGNSGSASVSFTVDATAPVVAISSPAASAFLASGAVDVLFNVTEANLDTLQCTVDGGAAAACTSPLNLNLADGAHTVLVSAVDLAGNSGNASVSFTVDATAPAVNITAPSAGAFLANGSVDVSFSITETNIASVECSVDGGAAAACTSPLSLNLADGAHSVSVTAVDSAGNSGSASVGFTVDTVNPTLAITFPTEGAVLSSTRTVAATFTSNGTGTAVASRLCSTDGGVSYQACDDTTTFASHGPVTLRVRVADQAGNQADAMVNFTIDILNVTFTQADGYFSPRNLDANLDHRRIDISIDLQESANVTARIVQGVTVIKVMLNNAARPAGVTTTQWDGRNQLSLDVPEGTYSIEVTAINSGGTASESPAVPLTVDRTGPTFVVSALPNRPVNGGTSMALTVTFNEPLEAAPNDGVAITVAQPSGALDCAEPAVSDLLRVSDTVYTANYTVQGGVDCVDGAVSVSVTGRDRATNPVDLDVNTTGFQNTRTQVFTVDFTAPGAPTIVLTNNLAPANDTASGTSEPNAVVRLYALDSAGAPVDVNGATDGMDLNVTANATGAWGPADMPGTVVQVCATQTDAAGNAQNLSVNPAACASIDNIPPIIGGLMCSPDPFSTAIGGTTTCAFTVDEAIDYTVQIRNATGGLVRSIPSNTGSSGTPVQFFWNGLFDNFDPAITGDYTVNVSASDAAGNTASQTTTVEVDNVAPTFTLVSVSPVPAGLNTPVTIGFNASEELDANPVVVVGGTNATLVSRSGLAYVYSYLAAGPTETKTVNISADDVAGNTGTTVVTNGLNVIVDVTTPLYAAFYMFSNPTPANDTMHFRLNENALADLANRSIAFQHFVSTASDCTSLSLLLSATITEVDGFVTPINLGDNLWASAKATFTDEAGNVGQTGCLTNDIVVPSIAPASLDDNRFSPGPSNPSPAVQDTVNLTYTLSEYAQVNVQAFFDANGNGTLDNVGLVGGDTTFGTAIKNTTEGAGPQFAVFTGIVDGDAGADGLYFLRLTATDNATNVLTQDFTVTIDNTRPTFSNLSVGTVNFNGTVHVNTGNVTFAFCASELLAAGPNPTIAGSAATATATGGNCYTSSLAVGPAFTEGMYGASVNGTDHAGNDDAGTFALSNVIVVDHTSPAFAVGPAAVAFRAGTSANIDVTVTDTNLASVTCGIVVGSAPSVSMTSQGAGVYRFVATGTNASSDPAYTVTCTDAAGNNVSAGSTIDITPAALHTLTVTPSNPSLQVLATVEYKATGVDAYSNDVALDEETQCAWSVTDGNAGAFNQTDNSTLQAGTLAAFFSNKVQAICQQGVDAAKTKTVSVTVTPGAVASVTATPNPTDVVAGAARNFSAVARDAWNNIRATETFSWTVGNDTVTNTAVGTIGASNGQFAARQSPTAAFDSVNNGPGSVSACAVSNSSVCGSATVYVIAGALNSTTVAAADANQVQTVGTTEVYSATKVDQYGNPVAATCVFSSGLGTIGASNGSLAARTTPVGSGNVTASCTLNSVEKVGNLAVTLVAAAPAHAHLLNAAGSAVEGLSVTVPAKGTHEFGFSVHDQYHNAANYTASACAFSTDAGSINATSGLFDPGALVSGNTANVTLTCDSDLVNLPNPEYLLTTGVTVIPGVLDHAHAVLTETDVALNNLNGDGKVRPGSSFNLDAEAEDADHSMISDSEVTFSWSRQKMVLDNGSLVPDPASAAVALSSNASNFNQSAPSVAGIYRYTVTIVQGANLTRNASVDLEVLAPQVNVAVPNPASFDPAENNGAFTVLQFSVDRASSVEIFLLNSSGQQVRDLFLGFPQSLLEGTYVPEWEGTDDIGTILPDGVYTVRVVANDGTNTATNDSRTVILDRVDPILTVTAAPNPAKAGVVTISVSSNEALASAPSASVDFALGADLNATVMNAGTGNNWTLDVTVAGGQDGLALASVSAIDIAGNTANGAANFTVDTILPAFLSGPANLTVNASSTQGGEIVLNITDVGAVNATFNFVAPSTIVCDPANSTLLSTGGQAILTCKLPPLSNAEGSSSDDAVFSVNLTDAAGNVNTSAQFTLDVVANALARFDVTDALNSTLVSADDALAGFVLSVQAKDAFGNNKTGVIRATLSTTNGAFSGVADADGNASNGLQVDTNAAGGFQVTLSLNTTAGVTHVATAVLETDANITGSSRNFTTVAGAPASVEFTSPPESTTTNVSADIASQTVTAVVKDQYNNSASNTTVTINATNGANVTGVAGAADADLNLSGFQVASGASGTVSAVIETNKTAGVTHLVSADIVVDSSTLTLAVIPGVPASISVTPSTAANVTADVRSVTFAATVLDANANPVADGTQVQFVVGDADAVNNTQAGTTASNTTVNGTASLVFDTGTKAGDNFVANVTSGNASAALSGVVIVVPGAAASVAISVSATSVSADIAGTTGVNVTATVRDGSASNNLVADNTTVTITPSDPNVPADNAGALPAVQSPATLDGVATAQFLLNTTAGDNYAFVATAGTAASNASANVTVIAGALAGVSVSVQLLQDADNNSQLAPGDTAQFNATARDAFNNAILGLSPSWSVLNGDVGHSLNSSGLFTAGQKAETVTVQASVTQGNVTVVGNNTVQVQSLTISGVNACPTHATPGTFSPRSSPGTEDFCNVAYSLDRTANVTIEVYTSTVDGSNNTIPTTTKVRTVLNAVQRNAGANSALWDGRNDATALVPAGNYVIRVFARDTTPFQNTAESFNTVVTVQP